MSKSIVRRKSALLMLAGVVSMVSALFVLAQPASAHQALIQGQLVCAESGQISLSWTATSFRLEGELGKHPDIIVDVMVDGAGWTQVGRDAFTDANGRRFSGVTPVPADANEVKVRVTPAPGVPWSGDGDQNGSGDVTSLIVTDDLRSCGSETEDNSGSRTPTPVPEEPTEEPTEVPTEEPTEVPTEEPTEVPTEEPTEVPTEEPTEVPTEEPTEVPTEEPTVTPAPEVRGPEPTTPTPAPEEPEVLGRTTTTEAGELARTGVESAWLTIVGVALLAGGLMVSVTGLSLARRQR